MADLLSLTMQQESLDLSSVFRLNLRGDDVFEATTPAYEWGAVYGGLFLGQALWAATQTVGEDFSPHSLHAYFVRGGLLSEPIRYEVHRLRDGKSFVTRRIVVTQSVGEVVTVIASFTTEKSPARRDHVKFPKDVAPAAELEGRWDAGLERRDAVFRSDDPRVSTWIRGSFESDSDKRIHASSLAYVSDLNLIDATVEGHPTPPSQGQWSKDYLCLSLDHVIWFHGAMESGDEWLLMDARPLVFSNNRGVAQAMIFSAKGELLATAMQEGLFRPRG